MVHDSEKQLPLHAPWQHGRVRLVPEPVERLQDRRAHAEIRCAKKSGPRTGEARQARGRVVNHTLLPGHRFASVVRRCVPDAVGSEPAAVGRLLPQEIWDQLRGVECEEVICRDVEPAEEICEPGEPFL